MDLSKCPNCGLTMPKFSLTCPTCEFKAKLSEALIGAPNIEPLIKIENGALSNSADSTFTLSGKNRCLACGANVHPTKIKCWKCGNGLVSASMTKEINPVHRTDPPTRHSMKEVKRENRKRRFLRSIKKFKPNT